jgi:uncharacterized SAM-binding protein YcdF (DUF218 family)
MEFVKRSIELIFSPLGIVAILMGAGIVLSIAKKQSRKGHRFLICGALLFLVFLLSPLSQFLIWNLEKRFPPLLIPPSNPPIDRIVILAGYAEDNPGIPITSNVSGQTLGNLSEGLRLYRLLPKSKLIVSGGVLKKGEKSVAVCMADFLEQMGVSKDDLIVEGHSQNTYENLREVRKLMGTAPFILVAAGCDMRRAMGVARKFQMNPIAAPANIWTLQKPAATGSASNRLFGFAKNWTYVSLDNLSRLQWAYHEYAGYLWYRILGYI